jgi:hypothetical protein
VSKRGLQLVKIGADARWRSPTFRNVYSPKTPQSSSNKQPMAAKSLELLKSLDTLPSLNARLSAALSMVKTLFVLDLRRRTASSSSGPLGELAANSKLTILAILHPHKDAKGAAFPCWWFSGFNLFTAPVHTRRGGSVFHFGAVASIIATISLTLGLDSLAKIFFASRSPRFVAMCHVWTAPCWQELELSSRLQHGRCSHVFGL